MATRSSWPWTSRCRPSRRGSRSCSTMGTACSAAGSSSGAPARRPAARSPCAPRSRSVLEVSGLRELLHHALLLLGELLGHLDRRLHDQVALLTIALQAVA